MVSFCFSIVLNFPSNFSAIVSSSRTEDTVETGTEEEFFQMHLTSLRNLDYLNFEQCTKAVFISMLSQFQFSFDFSW